MYVGGAKSVDYLWTRWTEKKEEQTYQFTDKSAPLLFAFLFI